MELYWFGSCTGRTERLYLGRETRTIQEKLFILKNSRDRRESTMGDVGKSGGGMQKAGRRGNKKEHNCGSGE